MPDKQEPQEHAAKLDGADLTRFIESIEDYAIFMLDPAGRVLSWNRGGERIKGYRRDEILGRSFACFYTDEDVRADKPARMLEKATLLGRAEDEGWRRRADGSEFWANVVITAVRDETGKILGFAKVTRDLTEKRARDQRYLEERIARAEAEARAGRMAVLQSISDASLGGLDLPALIDALLDRIRTYLTADTATLLLLDEATNDLVVMASQGLAQEVDERIPFGRGIAGRVAATREPLVVRDLRGVEVVSPVLREHVRSIAAVPLLDGDRVIGVLHVGARTQRDFVDEEVVLLRLVADRAAAAIERARTHTALTESERRFRATFEQAAVGLAVVGVDGQWLRVNHRLCEIVGYPEEELRALSFQQITHPDDLEADLAQLRRLLAGEIDEYALDKRYLRRGGAAVWIRLTVSLVRDDAGAPDYLISVVEDIGARRRAEEERDRLLVELREALSARDRFLSIASHELKTPLTTLKLQTHWFARSPAGVDNEPPRSARLRGRFDAMARQVDRLSALVEQLLDVTRVHEGRLRLHLEEVDLGELAREVAGRFEEEAAQAGSPIEVVAPGPVIGAWDRLRLDQVLTNLVSNAIKYGRGQAVSITVDAAEGRARVVVADQGIGIRAEDHGRLFGRFERLVPDESIGGLGLGLWITREIVSALGGTIRVESTAGQGARFIVELPRHAQAEGGDAART